MTGRERLLALAPLLWGADWHSAMGRELRVHRRTLGRYASGTRPVPEFLLQELEATAMLRIGKMAGALNATAALLTSDGGFLKDLLTFTAAGEPHTLPPDLRDRLRLVLEEVKAHRDANQETPDAAE